MAEDIRLQFLGAAQNVTGSCTLVRAGGRSILVDCGMFQERELRERNWAPFPADPAGLDAVLLTHAHLDHCGLLPKLVKEGFQGRVYCTPATAELARIVLLDSAHIQEEDAAFKRLRHEREGRAGERNARGEQPLYTVRDAERSLTAFTPAPYDEPIPVADGIEASFHEAGHILGSASILVRVRRGGDAGADGPARTVLFSGDVGRWGKPILNDPTVFDAADYLLVESTYGDRVHSDAPAAAAASATRAVPSAAVPVGAAGAVAELQATRSVAHRHAVQGIADELARVVEATWRAGGNLVIPSFAIGRAQELLYYLNELLRADRIPHLMVFIDSPMAVRATEVFDRHPELFDAGMRRLVSRNESPFRFPGLSLVSSTEESKALNHLRGTAVIIAANGMCTAGRIKHHLAHNISRPESTILFVGYQAEGTLGRQILEGAREVRLFGQVLPVRASVARIEGFSAHADRTELLHWVSGLNRPPRTTFVVHGERQAARSFAALLREKTGGRVVVPAWREEARLD